MAAAVLAAANDDGILVDIFYFTCRRREAAPTEGMVGEVMKKQLVEGQRQPVMASGGGGRQGRVAR